MRLAIIGGSLTGNKGAASMVLGILDALPEARSVVLSPLAGDDRDSPLTDDLTIVPFAPLDIVLACLLAPLTRLTRGRLGTIALRALWSADVVADVSGISFVSGRGVATLIYNVLLDLPAIVLGTPLVKVSQAMGPFDDSPTRAAARFVLPRLEAVLARGERTVDHLDDLGVPHEGLVPDAAFLMVLRQSDRDWAAEQLDRFTGADAPVVVVPSEVVVGQTEDEGASYLAAMTELVDHLTESRDVVIMAHSARPGQPAGRLNDIPLCESVLGRATRPDRCILVTDGTPQQLRAIMERAALVVTSRFHAMISALATATPVVVVGWSHKYREVLKAFGHEELAIDHRVLDTDRFLGLVDASLAARARIAGDLREALPGVTTSAARNAEALRGAGAR